MRIPKTLWLLPFWLFGCADEFPQGASADTGADSAAATASDAGVDATASTTAEITLAETTLPDTTPAETTPAETGASVPAVVDITFAAGPLEPTSGCFFTKDVQSAKGCSLYRVRWNVNERRALETSLVAGGDGAGYWLPAVSPSGHALAYARRDPSGSVDVELRSSDAAPGARGQSMIASSAPAPHIWTWPHWLDDSHVAVSHVEADARCRAPDGACQALDRWQQTFLIDASVLPVAAPVALLGFDTSLVPFASIEDVYRHPTSPRYVAGHGKEARPERPPEATCSDETAMCQGDISVGPTPRVVDRESGAYWTWALTTTWRGANLDVGGCAHLAFSPSGQSLICTIQATPTTGEQSDLLEIPFDPALPTGARLPLTVAPPFTHAAADALFELAPGEACDLYFTKYAEFCASDDLIVASVACACSKTACTDNPSSPRVIGSRVYLIDRRAKDAPVYMDLTASAAALAGIAPSAFGGFTSACSEVP